MQQINVEFGEDSSICVITTNGRTNKNLKGHTLSKLYVPNSKAHPACPENELKCY